MLHPAALLSLEINGPQGRQKMSNLWLGFYRMINFKGKVRLPVETDLGEFPLLSD